MKNAKVKYKPNENINLVFEFDVADQKDYMKTMSDINEVTNQSKCKFKHPDGKVCGSTNISPRVRVVDDNTYYELVCNTCFATFPFGCHKKGGTLFPKYSEGWKKYAQKEGEE